MTHELTSGWSVTGPEQSAESHRPDRLGFSKTARTMIFGGFLLVAAMHAAEAAPGELADREGKSLTVPSPSLADAEIENYRRMGWHCRSTLDGTNPSVVAQVKARMRNPNSFQQLQTNMEPEAGGEHTLDMAFTVVEPGRNGVLVKEVYATVDHATCQAHGLLVV